MTFFGLFLNDTNTVALHHYMYTTSTTGQTLEKVVLQAGRVFAPGQLAVGLRRVRETTHIQQVEFHPTQCCPQPRRISQFYDYERPILAAQGSLACCHSPPVLLKYHKA